MRASIQPAQEREELGGAPTYLRFAARIHTPRPASFRRHDRRRLAEYELAVAVAMKLHGIAR